MRTTRHDKQTIWFSVSYLNDNIIVLDWTVLWYAVYFYATLKTIG